MLRNLLFCIVIICQLGALIPAQAETLKLAADEWCPFNCEPESQKPGILIEIAKEVFEPEGISIDYKILPWARALSAVRSGAIDGLVGAGRGDAPDLVFPENPPAYSKYLVFGLSSGIHERLSLNELSKIKLGVIAEYSYGKTFDSLVSEAGKDSKLETTSGEDALQQNIKKLQLGRIDGVVSSPEVFYWEAAKLGLSSDKFKVIAEMPENDAIFIALSPKSPNVERYQRIFSEGIVKLKESGKIAKILAHYSSAK